VSSPHLSSTSAPSSPTHAAQALAALSSHTSNQQLSAEFICPVDTLDLLIDDFFTFIHPLCPFPHEPTFREAWKRREDLTNPSFLALLASMIGALVASFPRKPRLHLKAQNREKLFPNHMSFVLRCQKVCTMARGAGYLESENLNAYDAATSYLHSLACFYSFRWRQARLYLGESLTIIRTLGLHKARTPSERQSGLSMHGHLNTEAEPANAVEVDNITAEIGRRIFWTIFVSIKSMQQLGAASSGELVIPPPTSSEPYPPLPAELDDFCIFPTHNEQQPPGVIPVMAGFNANVRVYCSYNSLTKMELAWGIDAVVDWERQKNVLHESLQRCRESTEHLLPELSVDPRNSNVQADLLTLMSQPNFSNDAPSSLLDTLQLTGPNVDPEQRRIVQREIQKANIYASALASRSYIVEKYWNLCEAHERAKSPMANSPSSGITAAGLDNMMPMATSNPNAVEQEMRQERQRIVKDLLLVLSSINVVYMEPNADSFVSSTLFNQGSNLELTQIRQIKYAQLPGLCSTPRISKRANSTLMHSITSMPS
jgi:hypothetical protein